MNTREREEFVRDGCLTAAFACLLGVLVGLLALLLLPGCAATRPEPVAPLLSASPGRLATDSLPAPDVRYRRPNYARSLPTPYPPVPLPEPQPQRRGLLPALFGRKTQRKGGTSVMKKDKSRTTINVYTAPQKVQQKVKNSNVATDGSQLQDFTKAAKKQDEKPNQSTHAGVPAWQLVLGVVVLVIAVYALHRLT